MEQYNTFCSEYSLWKRRNNGHPPTYRLFVGQNTEIKGMSRKSAPESGAPEAEASHSKQGVSKPDIYFDRDRAVVQMLFNRPQASNALNDAMRTTIATELADLARDPDLYAMVIKSTDAQVFSNGSDIIELSQLARNAMQEARLSLTQAYTLNWSLDCFSKPTIALIDGAIMGAGAGLTHFCTHRVAAENYKFSMPETSFGFFPDTGMAGVLAVLPHHVGFYLALTGRAIGSADAYALGLLTHCIPRIQFTEIVDQLADAQPIDPLLDSRHQPVGTGELEAHYACISETFSAPTMAEVLSRLQRKKADYHTPEWIDGVIQDLNMRSPTALAVTHRHLQACRGLDLRDNLIQDYALTCRFLAHRDFYAGVNALQADKRNRPNWEPMSLAEVEEEAIADFFPPLHTGNLELPSREEMQIARL